MKRRQSHKSIFEQQKNGERSRKASLYAFVQTKALHLKPKVFFTSSPIPRSLACEVASFHSACEDVPHQGLCLVLLDRWSALFRLNPRLLTCEAAACRRVDVFTFYCASLTRRICRLEFSLCQVILLRKGDFSVPESRLRNLKRKFQKMLFSKQC